MARATSKSRKTASGKRSNNKKPESAPADTEEKPGRNYKDLVVTTIITLLVTGVFGEFIIKRNIQTFNLQRNAFNEAPAEAEKNFAEVRNFYNEVPGLELEYLEIVDDSFQVVREDGQSTKLAICVAAYVEGIRLIDNVYLRSEK